MGFLVNEAMAKQVNDLVDAVGKLIAPVFNMDDSIAMIDIGARSRKLCAAQHTPDSARAVWQPRKIPSRTANIRSTLRTASLVAKRITVSPTLITESLSTIRT